MVVESDFKRICWASRRGMLELDLIMMPFVEQRYQQLASDDQQRYQSLLEAEDTELFSWFLGTERPEDADLARIVDVILSFARPS